MQPSRLAAFQSHLAATKIWFPLKQRLAVAKVLAARKGLNAVIPGSAVVPRFAAKTNLAAMHPTLLNAASRIQQ